MKLTSERAPKAALLAALPWHAFALVTLPLARPRLLKKQIARREMRARTWHYLIAEANEVLPIARLGLSGEGAYLVLCEDTIGPERIGEAVRRAFVLGGPIDPAVLLRTLRGAVCVATTHESGVTLNVSRTNQSTVTAAFGLA